MSITRLLVYSLRIARRRGQFSNLASGQCARANEQMDKFTSGDNADIRSRSFSHPLLPTPSPHQNHRIKQAPRRREAVAVSGDRRGAKGVAGEVEPSLGSRVVDVKVIKRATTCHQGCQYHDASSASASSFQALVQATIRTSYSHMCYHT